MVLNTRWGSKARLFEAFGGTLVALWGVSIDHKGGNPAVYLGVDLEHMSFWAVGDVGFCAVEDVALAFFGGSSGHAQHICSVAWFGHAHACDPFARKHFGEVSFPLLIVGAVEEVVHKEHAVGQVGQSEAWIDFGEFVMNDDCSSGDKHDSRVNGLT